MFSRAGQSHGRPIKKTRLKKTKTKQKTTKKPQEKLGKYGKKCILLCKKNHNYAYL